MNGTKKETGAAQELRTFHLAGRGMEGFRPEGNLEPVLQDRSVLPSSGPGPLAALYGKLLGEERAAARSRFRAELKQSVARLQELLSIDRAKRMAASMEQVSASFGSQAGRFLAVPKLTGALERKGHESAPMDEVRRRRCETALTALEKAEREEAGKPVFWLFHAGSSVPEVGVWGGSEQSAPDPCFAALACSNQQLAELVPLLRAIRIARLEAVCSYNDAVHDELLERFDWQAADPHEIAALPVVVALEPAERLAHVSFASFSRLMRSGKPAQVLIPADGPCTEDLSGAVMDPGAIALAHRGAFVLQSSLARGEHLEFGLREMARSLRPAVAVVGVPLYDDDPASWREAFLMASSPAFPLYRYDPDRAVTWQDGFDLRLPGNEFAGLTAAEVLVASDRFRDHFRMIPQEAWSEDQMEIREYLKSYVSAPPPFVPFIEARDETGRSLRLAVTRELAQLSLNSARAWEMLTGMAAKASPVAAAAPAMQQESADAAYRQVLALLADPESLLAR
jgi:hypothetical protein